MLKVGDWVYDRDHLEFGIATVEVVVLTHVWLRFWDEQPSRYWPQASLVKV